MNRRDFLLAAILLPIARFFGWEKKEEPEFPIIIGGTVGEDDGLYRMMINNAPKVKEVVCNSQEEAIERVYNFNLMRLSPDPDFRMIDIQDTGLYPLKYQSIEIDDLEA